MNADVVIPQQDRFSQFVIKSLLLHLGIGIFFVLQSIILSHSTPIEYQSAARVDLIALPDKLSPSDTTSTSEPEAPNTTKNDPPPPPVAKALEKNKVDRNAIRPDEMKNKQSAAMDKLKQLSAFEKIQQDLESESVQKKAMARPQQIKGNVLSSGSQLTGVSRLQADAYIGQVEQKIRQNWALPGWLSKKNLSAQVRVRFDKSGLILSAQIIKPSGNATFDEIVVATVQKSSPVPPPPDKFVRILENEGIVFGFPE
jgi:colicin import membrane protein